MAREAFLQMFECNTFGDCQRGALKANTMFWLQWKLTPVLSEELSKMAYAVFSN